MASLRNLGIVILRARGDRNIAAALRHNARDAIRLLPLLGITSPWTRHPGTCRGSAGSRHPGPARTIRINPMGPSRPRPVASTRSGRSRQGSTSSGTPCRQTHGQQATRSQPRPLDRWRRPGPRRLPGGGMLQTGADLVMGHSRPRVPTDRLRCSRTASAIRATLPTSTRACFSNRCGVGRVWPVAR
jgi:hypothetical protein